MSYKTLVPETVNRLNNRLSLHFFDSGYNYYSLSFQRTIKSSSKADCHLIYIQKPGFSKG